MPKYKAGKPSYIGMVIFFLTLIAAAIYSTSFLVILTTIIVAAVVLVYANQPKYEKHFKKLLKTRKDKSICEFAKEFDRKSVDTWIIRATYEQVQNALDLKYAFPLIGSDRLIDDLLLDGDDIDLDLVEEISQRTNRTLEDIESNPLMGKVYTVKDLVLFFNHQPQSKTHNI